MIKDIDYRLYDAGVKVGIYLSSEGVTSRDASALQALVRDYVLEDSKEREALMSVVRMPLFQALIPFASSGSGASQMRELVNGLASLYGKDMNGKIDSFLCGVLGLSIGDEDEGSGLRFSSGGDCAQGFTAPSVDHLDHYSMRPVHLSLGGLKRQGRLVDRLGGDKINPGWRATSFVCLSVLGVVLGAVILAVRTPEVGEESVGDSGISRAGSEVCSEYKDLIRDLTRDFNKADPAHITHGTWQSVITFYEPLKAASSSPAFLDDYIRKARRAKDLEAQGCQASGDYYNY